MAGKMLKSLFYEKSLSKLSDQSEKSTAHPPAHIMAKGQTQGMQTFSNTQGTAF